MIRRAGVVKAGEGFRPVLIPRDGTQRQLSRRSGMDSK